MAQTTPILHLGVFVGVLAWSSAAVMVPPAQGHLEGRAFPMGGGSCQYEGRGYASGATVPTSEKCLSCRCERGAPLCRLQVCPELPVPPPRGCVLVHRRDECCQRLVCDIVTANTDSRVAASSIEAEVDIEPTDNGCVLNGTRYAEGSATGSSSLCEYCYCVRGHQRCVKPQCELPLPGCTPRYRSLACCPVSYDCSTVNNTNAITTTTSSPPRVSGCVVDGLRHAEGVQVHLVAGDCERCYCLRGTVRCVRLECAPPLMGCTPVFAKGRCCPVQYNCSKIITEPIFLERSDADITVLLQMDGSDVEKITSAELRRHREMVESSSVLPVTSTTETERGAGVEEQEDDTAKIEEPIKEEYKNYTQDLVTKSDDIFEGAETTIAEELFSMEARTEPEDESTTSEITETTSAEETTQPPSTTPEEITTDSSTTMQETTTPESIETSTPPLSTTDTVSSLITTSTHSPSGAHILVDRVDNLEELEGETDTTLAPQESIVSTTASTPSKVETVVQPEYKDEAENEYGEALPPSLPNITMIPFLPEDAVVDKKKESSYSSTESEVHVRSGVVQSQGFSPPAAFVGGFVPRKPPLLDDTPLYYPTSPQPEPGDILTAPQASMPPIISITTPSPEIMADSITLETTITMANPAATRDVPLASHIRVASTMRACISPDGREVPHGDLLASPGPCEVCRCDRGTVLCHEETNCSDKGAQPDRVESHTEYSTTNVPSTAAPEMKIAEKEPEFSLGSVFDFLFMGGDVTDPPIQAKNDLMEVVKTPSEIMKPPVQVMKQQPPNFLRQPIEFLRHPSTTTETTKISIEKPLDKFPPSDIIMKRPIDVRRPPAVEASTPVSRPRPTRPPLEVPPPPPLPPSVASILKLAGCNIYGRMYRVGRIISELSGPCRECRCTELGVQCRPLGC